MIMWVHLENWNQKLHCRLCLPIETTKVLYFVDFVNIFVILILHKEISHRGASFLHIQTSRVKWGYLQHFRKLIGPIFESVLMSGLWEYAMIRLGRGLFWKMGIFWFSYIENGKSYGVGTPFIRTTKITFSVVLHTMYAPQNSGSSKKSHFGNFAFNGFVWVIVGLILTQNVYQKCNILENFTLYFFRAEMQKVQEKNWDYLEVIWLPMGGSFFIQEICKKYNGNSRKNVFKIQIFFNLINFCHHLDG